MSWYGIILSQKNEYTWKKKTLEHVAIKRSEFAPECTWQIKGLFTIFMSMHNNGFHACKIMTFHKQHSISYYYLQI